MTVEAIAYAIFKYRELNGCYGSAEEDWGLAEYIKNSHRGYPDEIVIICIDIECNNKWK